MYTTYLNIRDYQITNIIRDVNPSTKCINNLINGIVKCAPLITAFITIGTVFALFEEVNARYIPDDRIERSSTTTFIPDDVKIVPIAQAVWLHFTKSPPSIILSKCRWSNFFCARPF